MGLADDLDRPEHDDDERGRDGGEHADPPAGKARVAPGDDDRDDEAEDDEDEGGDPDDDVVAAHRRLR